MSDELTIEIYTDNEQRVRWRLRHMNGEVMADSGQSYSRVTDLTHAIKRVTGFNVKLGQTFTTRRARFGMEYAAVRDMR